MGATSLAIEDLELRYGAVRALRGVDLSLEQGQFLALLGPSGCGKTSLLRSVAGFAHPQKGRIRIGDTDVVGLKPRERNLGMVFQHFALFPHMTAADNIAFGLKCRGMGKAEIAEQVTRILDLVDLAELAERRPKQLSGGQQQRVALARALVIEPDVLLLDEPLGALDKKLRIQMQSELQIIQKRLNVTSIFVTHDQEEAMAMADTIAIMRDGKIEQLGTPEQIFTAPETPWAAEFVGSGNVLTGTLHRDEEGLFRIEGAIGCDFRAAPPGGQTPDDGAALFVPAEKLRLMPSEAVDSLEVVSHRYLGIHVEVEARGGGRSLKALLAPPEARHLAVGARVTATADPAECRLIMQSRPTAAQPHPTNGGST